MAFITNHSLPTWVPSAREINTHLHEAWAHLRKVKNEVEEWRSAWLHAQANAAVTELNMTKEAAIRQIATEMTIKATFWKLRLIAKGSHSRAISRIKVLNHEWMYHQPTDILYRYVRGAF